MPNAAPGTVSKRLTGLRKPPRKNLKNNLQFWQWYFPPQQTPIVYKKPITQFSIMVVPPRVYWPEIQKIRARHDRHFRRFFFPHITGAKLPESFQDEHMEEIQHRVRNALRETEAVGHTEVIMGVKPTLFSFRAEQKYVMHLRERGFQERTARRRVPTALEVLFENLRHGFSDCILPKSDPHMTLGHWDSEDSANMDSALFAKSFAAMRWLLPEHVYILRRQFYTGYDHDRRYYPESITLTRCVPEGENQFSMPDDGYDDSGLL